MSIKQPVYFRPLSAIFLVLVMTAMWSLQIGHIYLDKHHHEEKAVCSDHQKDISTTAAHWHDAHFLTEFCSICDFVVVTAELPFFSFQLHPATVENWAVLLPCLSVIELGFDGDSARLRGPPAC